MTTEPLNPHIQEYIELVESGKYRVCEEQLLLVSYIRETFEQESIYVDEEQLEKYLAYQKYFPFELFPWEKFLFALHNCTYKAPGILRWPDLLMVVGRGAGKNGYLAFEDFCLLGPINGIKNYNIDICATSEEQAKTSFVDIYNVLENNKAKLSKHFHWTLTEIKSLKTGSVLKYRTSNAKTKDGGRPGKVDFDEYHAYENYALIEVFETGLGKVAMPRTTIATTMGNVRDGPLDNLLDDAMAILKRETSDNGLLPFICRLDSDEEVHDEANWYKANPSLQYFPELLRQLRKEYQNYKKDKFGNASFMTKRMNRPIGETEVPVAEWPHILATKSEPVDLTGKPCVFGLDYTKTTDFLGIGLLFEVDGSICWLTHSWVCEECRDMSRIRFPIKDSEKRGQLTVVKGVEIPPEYPVEWLKKQQSEYQILGGGLDTFRYSLLKKPLLEIGFDADKKGNNNLMLVRHLDIMQVAPTIISDFANDRIKVGDNQLWRWYVNNTKIVYVNDKKTGNSGNMLFGKIEPKTRKNDGFMAYVHANCQRDLLKSVAIPQDVRSLFRARRY